MKSRDVRLLPQIVPRRVARTVRARPTFVAGAAPDGPPMRSMKASLAILAAGVASVALAQTPTRNPLPPDHPLIGTWKFTLPNSGCVEIYDIRADGTMHVKSADQELDSEFDFSAAISGNGFYKWVDKVTRDNGKPDCNGARGAAGQVTTSYVRFHRTGRRFILCRKEDLDTCFGPFVQQDRM